MGRRRTGWWVVLAVAGLALLVGILALPRLLYPPLSTADLQGVRSPEKRIELQQAQAKLQNDARTSLLQAIAGGLLVLGAIATWRQVRISAEQLEVARRQALDSAEQGRHELAVARDGQIAELFTRAIDQLGDDKLDVQLGGIYALERIARDSEPDRATISRILAAFVRTHAPLPQRSPSGQTIQPTESNEAPPRWLRDRAPAIEAALAVLIRRPEPRDEQGIHLPLTDLRGAYLVDARLSGALFRYSNLAGSVMDRVHLERGELQEIDLSRARMTGAHLGKARLQNATLERTFLVDADLREANLSAANLRTAYLGRAKLDAADLREADFSIADLRDASLRHADLRGVDFSGARLEGADLNGVGWDATTIWPKGFDPDRRVGPAASADSPSSQPAGGSTSTR
jgi:Pentapeptide repeats (8 copies)